MLAKASRPPKDETCLDGRFRKTKDMITIAPERDTLPIPMNSVVSSLSLHAELRALIQILAYKPGCLPVSSLSLHRRLSNAAGPCRTKRVQSKDSQQAQSNGQRLLGPERTGNGASSEHDGSKKAEFDTVRLGVADAKAAEDVLCDCQSVRALGGIVGRTRVPTVTPATTEGMEPVRAKPVMPPPAVRAPRIRPMLSRDYGVVLAVCTDVGSVRRFENN